MTASTFITPSAAGSRMSAVTGFSRTSESTSSHDCAITKSRSLMKTCRRWANDLSGRKATTVTGPRWSALTPKLRVYPGRRESSLFKNSTFDTKTALHVTKTAYFYRTSVLGWARPDVPPNQLHRSQETHYVPPKAPRLTRHRRSSYHNRLRRCHRPDDKSRRTLPGRQRPGLHTALTSFSSSPDSGGAHCRQTEVAQL